MRWGLKKCMAYLKVEIGKKGKKGKATKCKYVRNINVITKGKQPSG